MHKSNYQDDFWEIFCNFKIDEMEYEKNQKITFCDIRSQKSISENVKFKI